MHRASTLPAVSGRKALPPLQRLFLLRDSRRLLTPTTQTQGRGADVATGAGTGWHQSPHAGRRHYYRHHLHPAEMRRLHAMIPDSAYHEIDSPFGHDGFSSTGQLNDLLLPFMKN